VQGLVVEETLDQRPLPLQPHLLVEPLDEPHLLVLLLLCVVVLLIGILISVGVGVVFVESPFQSQRQRLPLARVDDVGAARARQPVELVAAAAEERREDHPGPAPALLGGGPPPRRDPRRRGGEERRAGGRELVLADVGVVVVAERLVAAADNARFLKRARLPLALDIGVSGSARMAIALRRIGFDPEEEDLGMAGGGGCSASPASLLPHIQMGSSRGEASEVVGCCGESIMGGSGAAARRGFCARDRIVRTGKVVVQVKKRIVVRAPLAAVGVRPFPDLKMATGLWSL
jgi:hypothetical protein